LVAKYPFHLQVISYVLGISYNKFYRWYKDFLSGFTTIEEQRELHKNDIETHKANESTILVPILKPEHIGSHMAIDEKHINDIFIPYLPMEKQEK